MKNARIRIKTSKIVDGLLTFVDEKQEVFTDKQLKWIY